MEKRYMFVMKINMDIKLPYKMKNKKALSAVIATVLLILLVVVVTGMVWVFVSGILSEKTDSKDMQFICGEISFEASYNTGILYIKNHGNIPILEMNVKIINDGGYITKDLKDISQKWPLTGLNPGGTFSDTLVFNGDEIILIPVIEGESKSGEKTYVCDENQYGYQITI